VRQRVLERVFGLRAEVRLVQELGALEALEGPQEHLVRQPGDRVDHGERHVLADDRRHLEQPPLLRGESVDPASEDFFDRIGNRHRRRSADLLADGPGQLFDEERVALGLRHDELVQGVGRLVRAQQRPDDVQALLGGERLERHLGRVGLLDP